MHLCLKNDLFLQCSSGYLCHFHRHNIQLELIAYNSIPAPMVFALLTGHVFATSLLNYVYTGQVEITQANVKELVRVNLEKLATMWDFASSFNSRSVMETCPNLRKAQFKSSTSSDLFVRLPADTVLTLLQNDDLPVDSEEHVFAAISRWVCPNKIVDQERLEVHAPTILKEIRWCQTTVESRNHLTNSDIMFQESKSFHPTPNRWCKLPDMREVRDGPAAASLPGDSRIFVFGGLKVSAPLASVEFCSLRADREGDLNTHSGHLAPSCSHEKCTMGTRSHTHFGGRIIVAGGWTDEGKGLNTVEMFLPPVAGCPLGQWTDFAGMKEPHCFFHSSHHH
ncbi:unnamed protein product [Schistocephalus solidus]|uniref:BACK domain-containing protein n=1 Tax=Schistocephalus solidus TaxID=70667 RepID=A0A183T426_SCHSO|nr:unnamed protein product [Schistocephalus solidus]